MASGDHLYADFIMSGATGPTTMTEAGTFTGGTGRFANAEGDITTVVDGQALTAVYDGWLRYGR